MLFVLMALFKMTVFCGDEVSFVLCHWEDKNVIFHDFLLTA